MEYMCRLCLINTKKRSINVFSLINYHFSIAHILEKCADIKIEINDNLSKIVCNKCFAKLEEHVNFMERVQKADKILKENQINSESDSAVVDFIKIENDEIKHNFNMIEENAPCKVKNENNFVIKEEFEEENLIAKNVTEKNIIRNNKKIEDIKIDFNEEHTENDEVEKNNVEEEDVMDEINDLSEKISCTRCKKHFPSIGSLTRHNLIVHREIEICGKMEVLDQRPIDNTSDFKCPVCKIIFKTKPILNNHKIREHGYGKRTFKCEECDSIFKKKTCFQKHLKKTNHIKKVSLTINQFNKKGIVYSNIRLFECSECGKDYKGYYNIRLHIQKFHLKDKSVEEKNEWKNYVITKT